MRSWLLYLPAPIQSMSGNFLRNAHSKAEKGDKLQLHVGISTIMLLKDFSVASCAVETVS